MISTDLSTKYVVKNIFFRKVDGRLFYDFMSKQKEESHFIYQFCRHNKYERSKVHAAFYKQLEVSEHQLLKQIVKYKGILREFSRMVKANLDLSYYLMNNYARVYKFEEATELDILTLQDDKLKELWDEFRFVWETVIPKHEDTNPDVFAFAFMCQQNLNVGEYIKEILTPGKAKFIKLVLVDSRDFKF